MAVGLGFELLGWPLAHGAMPVVRVLTRLGGRHRLLVASHLTEPLVSWRRTWGWLDLAHRLLVLLGATASRSTDWRRSHVLLLLLLLLVLLGVRRWCRAGLRGRSRKILSLLAKVHASSDLGRLDVVGRNVVRITGGGFMRELRHSLGVLLLGVPQMSSKDLLALVLNLR